MTMDTMITMITTTTKGNLPREPTKGTYQGNLPREPTVPFETLPSGKDSDQIHV